MPRKKTGTFTFRAEIRQLLGILAHALYTDREIFLRELISNASDALNRLQMLRLQDVEVRDPDAELAIHVFADPGERTLIVRDSGVGMTRDELAENLGTIAHSGARAFLDSLAEGQRGTDIIGQFGVGFYSVFMVADEVRVTSRSARTEADEAWTWVCRGDDAYEIVPGEREERGTTVWLKLKEDAAEFADGRRVESVIHRHSDFVSYPIYLDGRVVNRQTALWRRPPAEVTDDVFDAFYRELTYDPDPPLARISMQTDVPVQLFALLFIPADAERQAPALRRDFGLQLYVRKVLIQAHAKELLPAFLRFVEGVVDTEDLPLNVSRETVQASPVVQRLRQVLSRKVLDTLKEMAEREPERYARFWRQYGTYLKEGLVMEQGQRERLLPLLRFQSSHTGPEGLTSLAEYVARMPEGQTEPYYVHGQDFAAAAASPHVEAFRGRGLEVLYLVDPLDGLLMPALGEVDGHRLRSVDDPSLTLPESLAEATEAAPAAGEALDASDLGALAERFGTVLGERVVAVRATDRLTDSPMRLVAPEDAADPEMDRLRRLVERDWEVPPRVVELNPRHPIVLELARLVRSGERGATVDAAIAQLYDNALLVEGLHPNPAHMVGRLQGLLAEALAPR
jgi:molecular chaperone HtpG